MNRERAKELLPIIQAFAEGKAVQSRWLASQEQISNEWLDVKTLGNFGALEYRIKPEPREFWIDPKWIDSNFIFEQAMRPNFRVIKVREVLE